ncbi:chitinase [Streptomyces sp. ODS28]|uniref:chitinase n=1 Tax=Streptomyces sp. ODS28 TaxID=3136688 RepID=UPI0031E7ECB8
MSNNAAHRRRTSRKAQAAGAVAAAAVVASGGFLLAGNATAGEEGAAQAGSSFAPYVDTSLQPSYDLVGNAGKTGVKEYNLGFITGGGGCSPKWGGAQNPSENPVAKQIGKLRAKGGDVRISFGGANGSELGLSCGSAAELEKAYGKVIDGFKLKKADFDIEGAALPDTAANTKRAKAIAALQKSHKGLDVHFTLPVLPEGLTQDGVKLLENAKQNGVKVSQVNLMAMDYGPNYKGDMGTYATKAATASQKQVKKALGLGSDAAAWKAVGLTPMIGVNDVKGEVFKTDDAQQVKKFADQKGLGGLSMWSATRDKACPGGSKDQADPTCSGIEQGAGAFTKAFTG